MPESTTPASAPQQLLANKQNEPILYGAICAELQQLINNGDADACLMRCLELVEQYPKAENFRLLLGISARSMGNTNLAIAALSTILKGNPEHINALIELGMAYYQSNCFDDALLHLEQAFTLNNQNAALAKNLSVIYYEYGLLDKAMHYCELTLALDPKNELQYGPALIQLAQGDYQHGWAMYEYRLQKKGSHLLSLELPTPRWDGKADLRGKTLLITWEQGYGDNIQFFRFVSKLIALHPATIYMLCPEAIAPLFAQLTDIQMLGVNFTQSFDIPAHDYQISLPSLPYLFKIIDESQFFTTPYLHADSHRLAAFRNKDYQTGTLQIGFCWAGGKQHIFNDWRSCGLDFFIPLLAYKKARWLSLQRETSEDEQQILRYSNMPDLGAICKDFADTAAIIELLDVIICVDTAIAHLAGAMGKPVWLLARYQTEWRHPRGRTISPWYPSMRIMRQAKPGDWDSVRQQVEAALEAEYHVAKIEGT